MAASVLTGDQLLFAPVKQFLVDQGRMKVEAGPGQLTFVRTPTTPPTFSELNSSTTSH